MNYLTGASACTRKAIYELLVRENAEGENYEDKIRFLRDQHREIDEDLFEVLGHIQHMTSDKVHEQSWDKWDSQSLSLLLETLKALLHELYVVPDEKRARTQAIRQLREQVSSGREQTGQRKKPGPEK